MAKMLTKKIYGYAYTFCCPACDGEKLKRLSARNQQELKQAIKRREAREWKKELKTAY